MTRYAPDDEIRTRIIWSNILEALDDGSVEALLEARHHADNQDDPIDEALLLFSVTCGLLGRLLVKFVGDQGTRRMITMTLLDNELREILADNQEPEG